MSILSPRKFSAEFNVRGAPGEFREERTIPEFLQNMAAAFDRDSRPGSEASKVPDKLYAPIGLLKVAFGS